MKRKSASGTSPAASFTTSVCIPKILDYVEDLLGPNYFLGLRTSLPKRPATRVLWVGTRTPIIGRFSPHNSVTAWLAFTDSDEGNAAMRVIPRSQSGGLIKHKRSSQTDSVLTLELERGSFREDEAVPLVPESGGDFVSRRPHDPRVARQQVRPLEDWLHHPILGDQREM